jgi:hypothetical protein
VFDTACQADLPGDAPGVGVQRCRTELGDPVSLQSGAPVEPLVLRANAGDCIDVTLRNALPFTPTPIVDEDQQSETIGLVIGIDKEVLPLPDLAGWQDMMWAVTRRIQGAGVTAQMYFFNNNLIRPSSFVGLHPQLVAYDITRDDGVLVGQNESGQTLVNPGGQKLLRWYAGDIRFEPQPGGNPNQRNFARIPTPVEFGGVNLLSADRIKQPQKGLFGALVIEPEGATYPDAVAGLDQVPDGQAAEAATPLATRGTRAQVTVDATANQNSGVAGSAGTYREALVIGHKIANLRWADGSAVRNVNQGELGVEGAEDSGHAGFNYGMEPSWFRFKLPPDAPFGNAGTAGSYGAIPNVQAFYANALVLDTIGNPVDNAIPEIAGVSEAGDPQTPVFRAQPGQATRMHVLNGASADRDGTFVLHGHLWQRDPFVCPGQSDLGLDGRCGPNEPVPSQALGDNPQGKYMGSEEGMGHVFGHWPILFDAGGSNAVQGDYLFSDYAPNGNRNGQFGLLRVADALPQQPPVARDDLYTMECNTVLIVAAPGVLGNDNDPDSDPLIVSAVNGAQENVGLEITLASGATLTLNADGSFTYMPDFDFAGTDSFTYVANDGLENSNVATVTITVGDVVEVVSASYRTRRDRWDIQGTVSVPTNSVEVYLNTIHPDNLIGSADVDSISGEWLFEGPGGVGAIDVDTVIAVSSGCGVSDPFPVRVRN